jgi:dienelactone hydrolase
LQLTGRQHGSQIALFLQLEWRSRPAAEGQRYTACWYSDIRLVGIVIGQLGNGLAEILVNIRLSTIALVLSFCSSVPAQQLSRERIIESLEKDGCVTLEERKTKICKYNYSSEGKIIEALSFRPLGQGPFPGLLLVPGYQGSAMTLFPLAIVLAQQGFVSISVAQPGFGKSQGKPDFVGPHTVNALIKGFNRLRNEPYVDKKRMGVFGGSRGAIAASLMAVRLKDIRSSVFASGIYDFKRAYDEIKIEGIRENMRAETGMTPRAIRQRSSIREMKNINGPVLILHGEKDENAPVSQAILLRDRLTTLGKDFEIILFPDAQHALPGSALANAIDFFSRKLKGVPARDLPRFR